jgi:glycine dehydrogenase
MNLFEQQANEFATRHIGPNEQETSQMLDTIGVRSMEELLERTIPGAIRLREPIRTGGPISEYEYLAELRQIAAKNLLYKNFIGQGYYGTIVPSVILRNVFENPGWYTQYTPYQAEISQGRLEGLLNFQTLVADLTGLPLANASLLDEGTAAAEAMTMLFHQKNRDHEHVGSPRFFVDQAVYQQTLDILKTRAEPLGIQLECGNFRQFTPDGQYFGCLLQYPNSDGAIFDYHSLVDQVHLIGGFVVLATDLLALTLLASPGDLGADVAVGSSQRFGVPLGFGGPHAAFFACRDDFKRAIPGRIIGVSVDAQGNRALRMALQTREQHIKREKATSNICTAQALLANMAAMYAVYHGPEGLKGIAHRVSLLAHTLSVELAGLGLVNENHFYFDTLKIAVDDPAVIRRFAESRRINFHYYHSRHVGISLDETTTQQDVVDILSVFAETRRSNIAEATFEMDDPLDNIPETLKRKSPYLTHPVFHTHRNETAIMRYIKSLENRDLSLNQSMIPLGSCTMKLNAATELIPLSWPEFSQIHPFAPAAQWMGYRQIIDELSSWLNEITGFQATSLQPNSGAQGEFAGLLTIRAYHESRKEGHRRVMLIPISAHGTNPASAVMAGMQVIPVKSDDEGHIDFSDLREKAERHGDILAGLMITYPSTHGVFEEGIRDICQLVHEHGGLVYMDGANMNAQVGLTSPGNIGADICHLNLHKTFAIPHGGGGPGMGPICAEGRLKAFLPSHFSLRLPAGDGQASHNGSGDLPTHAVSSAAFGSASILLISYGYIRMLGPAGMTQATEYAILNANYMKTRLEKQFDILYSGKNGSCAHEFIIDLRSFKASAAIEAEDVAKRLMDYGFHAPTLSFPVAGTIMVEPTESEEKSELDRFCDAMLGIRAEIRAIEEGRMDRNDNPLKNAPHTLGMICANDWSHPYSRQEAAFPSADLRENKFWPSVARVNNTAGDRNLVCTCEPVSAYAQAGAH